MKYSAPLRALVDIRPQISKCISANMPFSLLSLLKNVSLTYFPSVHPLHTPSCSVPSFGALVTISLSILSAPWCKCPILLCHKSSSTFPLLLSLPISTIGESRCNLYNLLLQTSICLTLFQLKFLTNTFFPTKWISYPLSCSLDIEIRFIPNPGTCNTFVVLVLALGSL